MNVEKVSANLAHAAIIGSLSWIAAHSDAGLQWLIPALAWLGQCLSPPDMVPGQTLPPYLEPKPPAIPPPEVANGK